MFQSIYGENVTKQIIFGKAAARANRAHILTGSVLLIKLHKIALAKNTFEWEEKKVDIEEMQQLYNMAINKSEDYDLVIPSLQKLNTIVKEKNCSLREISQTIQLYGYNILSILKYAGTLFVVHGQVTGLCICTQQVK